MTLNGIMATILCYLTEFGSFRCAMRNVNFFTTTSYNSSKYNPLLNIQHDAGRGAASACGLCAASATLLSAVRFLANVNSRSRSLYAIARPSVCRLSVCRLSVTLVHLTQAVEIFSNISTAFGTLAIP